MIFASVSALCSYTKIVINSFGADNTPEYLKSDESILNLPTPIREDGAKFLGWYYSLNFDEKYKAIDPTNINYIVLNAKYDKCYCFTLRNGVLGPFGKETSSRGIHYHLPKGEYKVCMTEFTKCHKGSIKVYKNHLKEETLVFDEVGKEFNLSLDDKEYLAISANSVFLFQRVDVNPKFIKFNLE